MKTITTMTTMTTLIALPLLILFTSCRKTEIENDNRITVTEKSAKLIKADNEFGLELFRKITQAGQEDENTMVSPLSVSLALAMAYNGAEGETKTAMEKTLKLYGLTPEEINKSYQQLVSELKSVDSNVKLDMANAIFYRQGLPVEQNFITLNKKYYDAGVQALNFSSPDAVNIINGWVAEKTNNKIPTIVQQIFDYQVMILLNAIYFNGLWKDKFDEKGTHNQLFYLKPDNSVEIPMMSQENKVEYTSNSLFAAIKLLYGKGQFSMVVFLPGQNKTSRDLIGQLNMDNWETWMDSFEMKEHVVITMPRFKFAFETDLNAVLSSMGMAVAFNPNLANFKGIAKLQENIYVDNVKHKTYIDVNETGTEAAAVTAITFGTTSIDPTPKIYFHVDKPFLFAITEKDTGAILFIGEVSRPEYKSN